MSPPLLEIIRALCRFYYKDNSAVSKSHPLNGGLLEGNWSQEGQEASSWRAVYEQGPGEFPVPSIAVMLLVLQAASDCLGAHLIDGHTDERTWCMVGGLR